MKAKRLFDLAFTIPGVVALSPLLVGLSVWVKLDSKGSVFFQQTRVGLNGRLFKLYKFRTMVPNAEAMGPQLTTRLDQRVTRAGQVLRRLKFDELPQLFNVLKGDMSLVGPRPEVPRYVEAYPEAVRKLVLSRLPGITDRASIQFRQENELLTASADPERTYLEAILPVKLSYYVHYVQRHTLWGDLRIILETLRLLVFSKTPAAVEQPGLFDEGMAPGKVSAAFMAWLTSARNNQDNRTQVRLAFRSRVRLLRGGRLIKTLGAFNLSQRGMMLDPWPSCRVGAEYRVEIPLVGGRLATLSGTVVRSDPDGLAIILSRPLEEDCVGRLILAANMNPLQALGHGYRTYLRSVCAGSSKESLRLLGVTRGARQAVLVGTLLTGISLSLLLLGCPGRALKPLTHRSHERRSLLFLGVWVGLAQPAVALGMCRYLRERHP